MKHLKEQDIKNIISSSKSMAEAAKKCNVNYKTFRSYAQKYNLWRSNQPGKGIVKLCKNSKKYPLDKILSGKFPNYTSSTLRERLIKNLGWIRECSVCKLQVWNSKPIPLELHHTNGNSHDHRLENLKLLCPNCHAQTDTYCGKNIKKRLQKQSVVSERHKYYCPKCGAEKSKLGKHCIKCANLHKRKVENRPEKEILITEVKMCGYVKTGKKYGVSDNTIRKWLKDKTVAIT